MSRRRGFRRAPASACGRCRARTREAAASGGGAPRAVEKEPRSSMSRRRGFRRAPASACGRCRARTREAAASGGGAPRAVEKEPRSSMSRRRGFRREGVRCLRVNSGGNEEEWSKRIFETKQRRERRERDDRLPQGSRSHRCDRGAYFRNSARKVGSPGGHGSAVLM